MLVQNIQRKLKELGSREKAKVLQRFFKTGPGEYGEGDVFVGVKVPELRKLAKEYHEITVKVSNSGMKGSNVLVRNKSLTGLNSEFRNVYSRHFINFAPAVEKYTPLDDSIGNYLVISYSSFMDEMADFVTWKESIGYVVDLVDYSTIGSSAALKTYVSNYYNSNGLTFLLLVGDNARP